MARRLRVVALCTVETGLDVVSNLLQRGHVVDAIVGLPPSYSAIERVSGWSDVKKFGQRWSIPAHYVRRYDLDDDQDRSLLEGLSFDILLVYGWQRLVPEWLLSRAVIGSVGAHGSPDGIVAGRGRSPQNWAIILGCTEFKVSLFRLSAGVDDGPEILSRSFRYQPWDDIAMSYRKNALCVASMMSDVLDNPGLIEAARSQQGEAFYFPQRRPDDGLVDWHLSAEQIWAHCRALTHPYPGLRTWVPDGSVGIVWRCEPFDESDQTGKAGMIHAIFQDGSILVECGDGRVLLTEHELLSPVTKVAVGDVLVGRPFRETLEAIYTRHTLREPGKAISPRLRDLLSQS